jgi:hypothetical protein
VRGPRRAQSDGPAGSHDRLVLVSTECAGWRQSRMRLHCCDAPAVADKHWSASTSQQGSSSQSDHLGTARLQASKTLQLRGSEAAAAKTRSLAVATWADRLWRGRAGNMSTARVGHEQWTMCDVDRMGRTEDARRSLGWEIAGIVEESRRYCRWHLSMGMIYVL